MTPQAKWTKFDADNTFVSGNGWLQHTYGTYEYNAANGQIKLNAANEPEDEFGPFSVMIMDDQMTWKRDEGGMEITVKLDRIEALPMAPADQIKGVWGVEKVISNGRDMTDTYDPNDDRYLFLRWDRVFVMDNTPEGRLTGYWHTHGHRPEVTLLFHDTSIPVESYMISIKGNILTLTNDEMEIQLKPRKNF
jgi:hypothetical protein